MTKRKKTLEQQYRGLSQSAWWLGTTMLVAGPLVLVAGGVFIAAGVIGALHWVYAILGVLDVLLGGTFCVQGYDFHKNVVPSHERTAERMKGLGW